MDSLAIINREEQKHKIDDNVIKEIEEYLDILDLCKTIDVVNSSTFVVEKRKVFIQPGLRYAQAKALKGHGPCKNKIAQGKQPEGHAQNCQNSL